MNNLTYKNYHATFHNDILNIYNTDNKLVSSKVFSQITSKEEVEYLFKLSVNSQDKPIYPVSD